ncbi:MAG: dephospho-CoA kinase [Methylococcales bacterium]|jgi:dephospho-CoA kinase|nr:dephospho-CoA kinase [Methylococcaceae bacterium]HIL40511.1 dephospho-CoA kinase [Methylococcales bacterium]
MLKIGLTGGIGSGKSTAANHFESLGVPVIDADEIAHQLTQRGQPALQQIAVHFSSCIDSQGHLLRAELREQIFSNPTQKQRLENILHPLIRNEILAQLLPLKNDYVVLCIPLLVEKNLFSWVDRTLVIDCPEALQIIRVQKRSNLSTPQIKKIIACQASPESRLSKADDIITNNGSTQELAETVKKLHNSYQSLCNPLPDQ